MVGLTKFGMDNVVWYSRERDDKNFEPERIIQGMYNRFLKHKDAKNVQVLQFYDNRSGSRVPLAEYRP